MSKTFLAIFRATANWFSCAMLAISLAMSPPTLALCAAQQPLRVLFLGDDGPHRPAARFAEIETEFAARGFQLVYTDQISDLKLPNLRRYDALILYANIDTISREYADALLQYVASGGGFVPLHCASFCFRNQPDLVALMGAQFQRHGTGVFQATVADPDHVLTRRYGGFRSWDETYVHHLHNEENRTVLEYRVDREGREPWTWIRTHGEGRVFYTAWGHDERTWTHPGFHNLVQRGILWVTGGNPTLAGDYLQSAPFPNPKTAAAAGAAGAADVFQYVDVGQQIPNYTPSSQWGTQADPLNRMQLPLPPDQSMQRMVVPEGFHLQLFASEPDLQGKPICMAWDARGRLWVAETYDYPNELQPIGEGRDRIRICEDTTGDGRADQFTIFAEQLSIPTSIAFVGDGVLVQDGTETVFLQDTTGDDRADVRRALVTNWQMGDTHGGVSNFQYGLDNWIWAMQGYNNSQPVALGQSQQAFRMGFFRMKPDGSEVEFIRSTNNNTWGLGISEEGLVFGSTANGNPSIYMPIPNRYYERVRGWTPSLTLSSIADTNQFRPITDKVRQVDHHGGYTAAAGHALYTARSYPREYWNRTAFVNGPTGHLVGTFVLERRGTDFTSTSPFNLLASDDEWTAPIMAEVGPDGNVWVIDWYNYIIQHNPTPQGFTTGKGRAYETDLRDKKHGRIYRVVPNSYTPVVVPDLQQADSRQRIAALSHPTMLVRKHAQRLLVEAGDTAIAPELIALLKDDHVDEIGLNVAAIHALWTLQGLGLLQQADSEAALAVYAALSHPSAGVRRNAVQVLPHDDRSVAAIEQAGLIDDRDWLVRLAAVLALVDLPPSPTSAVLVSRLASNPAAMADRWLPDAVTSAAAHNDVDFLNSLADLRALPDVTVEIARRTANHYARGEQTAEAPELLAMLADAPLPLVEAILQGLSQGFSEDRSVRLTAMQEERLDSILQRLPLGSKGVLIKLATAWGSERFGEYGDQIVATLLGQVSDVELQEDQRSTAARQALEFRAEDPGIVAALLEEVHPRTAPGVVVGILDALALSRAENVGPLVVERFAAMTPTVKKAAVGLLLARPAATRALLRAAEAGKLSLAELALDQQQALRGHADREIHELANRLLESGGMLPSADRQQVLDQWMYLTKQSGDPAKGKLVYKTHCAKCHVHSGEGVAIGPDLTGMAVHPKEELLIHILDPSRSVEGNFRAYSVLTVDGVVLTGMLASESKTAIELFDTEGRRQSLLREDIEEFEMSPKSIMPEGFESAMKPEEMSDLLEFLTQRGRFVPLDLSRVATVSSDRGMFYDRNATAERLDFGDWLPRTFAGVPFQLIDPRAGMVANAIVLRSPNSELVRRLPRRVRVPIDGKIAALHVLGGVSGWGSPYGQPGSVSMIVRFHFQDGQREDHELRNGRHLADYIRRVDVPDSQFAFDLHGRQLRYLVVHPSRDTPIHEIELLKGPDNTAPVVMALTAEMADH